MVETEQICKAKPPLMLQAGAYGFAIEHPCVQHKYAGGGHGGCGGCIWALEFTGDQRLATFLVYEYRTDCDGQRHRMAECESLEDCLALWNAAWGWPGPTPQTAGRFTPWTTEPPWFYRK